MAPTKYDPLVDRMIHAFGHKRINSCFSDMLTRDRNLLDHLTAEARDELLGRCIVSHKRERRFSSESRKHYQQRRA